MVDSTGTTNYAYDSLNRLTCVGSVAIVSGCPSGNVGYQYDSPGGGGGSPAQYPGQWTRITYPDGKTVTYTYEPDGRMKTVTDWLGKQTVYNYDSAGRLDTAQYPNGSPAGVLIDYSYDNSDRLTGVVNTKGGTISSFTYMLDAMGNRKTMVDLSGTHSYQYDSLYRLTQADYPGPDVDSYTYDANGNRKTKGSTNYAYDGADRLTCSWSGSPTPVCPSGSTTYAYDNNGNQAGRTTLSGTDMFVYDYDNRLTSSTIAGAASLSTYNGDGLRMSHTPAGQVAVNYAWDVAAGLPVVLQDNTNTYVYGLDLISATDNAGVQTYFLYDGLGSTVNLTNGSGAATASYSYDVFGALRSGGGTNQWLFTGEQRDADSALYYLRARYYDPGTARFLGRDPTMAAEPYAYVSNNPANWVDPSGLCALGAPCVDIDDIPIPAPPDPRQVVSPFIDLIPEGTLFKLPFLGNRVSYQLAMTCLLYPEACAAALTAKLIADWLAEELYNGNHDEGTRGNPKEGDAFQHCFWSGLITFQVGANKAEAVTTRYEATEDAARFPDQRQYDLYNNRRGRLFASATMNNPSGPIGGIPALYVFCRG
jgi:RHS repeat-associated protein